MGDWTVQYNEKCCPHCKSPLGLYVRVHYVGLSHTYNFDGTFDGEHNGEASYQFEKKMYCCNCGKYVCKVKEFAKMYSLQGDFNIKKEN